MQSPAYEIARDLMSYGRDSKSYVRDRYTVAMPYTLKTRVKNPTLLLTPSEQHFMNTSASVNNLSVNKLTCALIL